MGSDFKISGNWNNTANAGVFYRNLNNNRSNDNNNYSFRASDYKLHSENKEKTEYIGNSYPSSEKFAEDTTLPSLDLYSHNLYEKIISLDNLYDAYLDTRKSKIKTKRVFNLDRNIGTVLKELHYELKNGTYKVSSSFMFTIYEPKERLISSPNIRDSIVQHAIYRIIYASIDKKLIFDSHGCRKGKGSHSASDRLQSFMRQYDDEDYMIQIDIRKYYFRINHEILKNQLMRFIPCEKLVDLMMQFVNTIAGIGLNVGNLLAQLYGLIYLNQFDHFIKRKLKIKHYIRYVDDMCFIGFKTIDEAKATLDIIVKYLKDVLGLELSKFRINKIKKGANFVGFRTWKNIKLIRKRTLYNFRKAIKNNNIAAINSILGHSKRTSSFRYLFGQVIQEIKNKGNNYDSEIQRVYRNWRNWVYLEIE